MILKKRLPMMLMLFTLMFAFVGCNDSQSLEELLAEHDYTVEKLSDEEFEDQLSGVDDNPYIDTLKEMYRIYDTDEMQVGMVAVFDSNEDIIGFFGDQGETEEDIIDYVYENYYFSNVDIVSMLKGETPDTKLQTT